MGAPPRSSGRFSRAEVEGKTVERVAIEERWRTRRAWMADSWTVGMCVKNEDVGGGLEKRCCGTVENDDANGTRKSGRPVVMCMM